MSPTDDVHKHYRAAARHYSQKYQSSYEGYPANQIRLDLLLRRLREIGPKTLLDCGCGEGTPLCRFSEIGIEVWGFDLVGEMVELAKANLTERGLSNRVWEGDIQKPESFTPAGIQVPEVFDMCLAMGVFPHLENEISALRNMAASTRKGGRLMVEFRNELFSLFTFNRHSYDFFCEELVRLDELAYRHPEYETQLGEVREKLAGFFRMDLPRPRKGSPEAPGYDDVLSKFHNPYEAASLFREANLDPVGHYFYHFHVLPPLFEQDHPDLFRNLSLELEETPSNWRGHFMASAFIVEAVKR